ncbi:hypothetical protein MUP07_00885 [Candidatus Bathyarchaeota archaeon]|nr:hypothetical protein [Candidatus Bathyarchaeota archaeon]
MTGDRRLTAQEMLDFKLEKANHRFDALKIVTTAILDGKEEPTLFEVAILELAARVDGHKELLADLYRQIRTQVGEEREDWEFRAKMQATVKEYARTHPGEITLPCEKHHRLPCSDCELE